jgi:hypothetical protein
LLTYFHSFRSKCNGRDAITAARITTASNRVDILLWDADHEERAQENQREESLKTRTKLGSVATLLLLCVLRHGDDKRRNSRSGRLLVMLASFVRSLGRNSRESRESRDRTSPLVAVLLARSA